MQEGIKNDLRQKHLLDIIHKFPPQAGRYDAVAINFQQTLFNGLLYT